MGNFRSSKRKPLSNQKTAFSNQKEQTQIILDTMQIWVFRQVQWSGKLLKACFQVILKLD